MHGQNHIKFSFPVSLQSLVQELNVNVRGIW